MIYTNTSSDGLSMLRYDYLNNLKLSINNYRFSTNSNTFIEVQIGYTSEVPHNQKEHVILDELSSLKAKWKTQIISRTFRTFSEI
jgi:hypothetical protein